MKLANMEMVSFLLGVKNNVSYLTKCLHGTLIKAVLRGIENKKIKKRLFTLTDEQSFSFNERDKALAAIKEENLKLSEIPA